MKQLRHPLAILAFGIVVPVWAGILACSGCSAATMSLSAAAQTPLASTTFVDPFEHSFSVEVPQGWTVHGGLFRMCYSDERPMVDLASPDGHINVRIGDLSIPTYALPNPYHPREGEVYDLGAQAQMVVARYRSGPEFAVLYSHVRFYRDCRDAHGDAESANFTLPDLPSRAGCVWKDDGRSNRISLRRRTRGAHRICVFPYD